MKKSPLKKKRPKDGLGEIARLLREESGLTPFPKKIRLRGPAPSRKLVRQIASLSKRNRRPDPRLQSLFERMADEVGSLRQYEFSYDPDNSPPSPELRMTSVSACCHRAKFSFRARTGDLGQALVRRSFEVRTPRRLDLFGKSGEVDFRREWDPDYVEVRVRGMAPARVSANVASAVLAVALR